VKDLAEGYSAAACAFKARPFIASHNLKVLGSNPSPAT
jgi:hypothetical protein